MFDQIFLEAIFKKYSAKSDSSSLSHLQLWSRTSIFTVPPSCCGNFSRLTALTMRKKFNLIHYPWYNHGAPAWFLWIKIIRIALWSICIGRLNGGFMVLASFKYYLIYLGRPRVGHIWNKAIKHKYQNRQISTSS